MRNSSFPPLAALIVGAFLAGFAGAQSTPANHEEAVTMARAHLAKCEQMSAQHTEYRHCIRICSRAIAMLEAGGGLPFEMYYENCSGALQSVERRRQQPAAPAAPAPAIAAPVSKQAASTWTRADAVDKAGLRIEGAIDWNAYEAPGVMHDVFTGDFELYRKGAFSVELFLHLYLSTFESRCAEFMPPDAVLMVNTHTQKYRNAYGAGYDVVKKSKIRMAPRFVPGYQNYDATRNAYNATGGLGNPNAVKQVLGIMEAWSQNVGRFFDVEPCQGPVMLQMSENLARLTSGKRPIQAEPNAAKLLAGLRVNVEPTLEQRDRRTKKANADAYWNAERLTWSEPPRVQSGTFKLVVDYRAVPPDYVIPIPLPSGDQFVEIIVNKPYGRRILAILLRRGTVSGINPADYTPDQKRIYDRYWRALHEEGVYVLACQYSALSSSRMIHYWHRTAPKALDVAAMKAEWAQNPLLAVRAPRTHCPVVMP